MSKKKKIELDVRGMTCDTCPDHVKRALESVDGVETVEIPGWQSNKAIVTIGQIVAKEDLTGSVKQAGYQATVKTSPTLDETLEKSGIGSSNGRGGNDFDLLVIGAGSAGFAAAIRGVDLGFNVGMIGDGDIGGTCVNIGCVPSKALIRAAEA